ncbi:hypothetical protein BJX96DRAFT_174174 [Aspergillus floccosus]
MVELTVGYISGIIAAVVFVVRLLFPSASALILVGLLQDTQTASTWTVVARSLQSSLWPTILRSDSTTSTGVSRVVWAEEWTRLIVVSIISLAGIITPLGLYEAVVPDHQPTPQPFTYARDLSVMGQGTPPRSRLGFNRNCDPYPCPGTDKSVYRVDSDGRGVNVTSWNVTIPQPLVDIFGSGRGTASIAPTVSSIWDIQWRNYEFQQFPEVNNGAVFQVGAYRQMEIMALSNRVEVVEGLIVDTRTGGVGFRNHSLPPSQSQGSKWTEDVLFVEPQTSCVDLNLTIDFALRLNGYNTEPANVSLTDRGGFSHLSKEQPDHSQWPSQDNVDLQHKAYTAAWLTNAYTMLYLNVTNPAPHSFSYINSTPGKRFPLRQNKLPNTLSYDALYTTTQWADFLDVVNPLLNWTDKTAIHYSNPFNITRTNLTVISMLCAGAGLADYANMTNIGAACGMVYGAARRTDGGASLVPEPDSQWTIPIYACASAAKAVIKTVDFHYNDSSTQGGLAGLNVENLTDKVYSKPEDRPTWGVENTTLPLHRVQPLWGLVSSAYGTREDITLLQKESLWLPGQSGVSTGFPVSGYINLPGIDFHTRAYEVAYDLGGATASSVADYSGKSSNAMYARWQQLSETPNTTSAIINLIWTDLVANSVVGTRGWSSPDMGPAATQVPVLIYRRKIQYRLPFAVPAFIVLSIVLATAILMVILGLCGHRRARPAVVRRYLNSTSLGRAVTILLGSERIDMQVSTTEWLKLAGTKQIDLGGPIPRTVANSDEVDMDNSDTDEPRNS